jgi:hypothetical protein
MIRILVLLAASRFYMIPTFQKTYNFHKRSALREFPVSANCLCALVLTS